MANRKTNSKPPPAKAEGIQQINVGVRTLSHRRLKVLASILGENMGEAISDLVDQEWERRNIDIPITD